MTITREVREKVIQLSKEGHGRNEIARLLNKQGLHVSEGSVGNIVRANRQLSYDAAQKSIQFHADVDEQSFANTNDTPSDPVPISAGIDKSNIGSRVWLANVVIPRDGGPLSHLLNEDSVNPDSTVIPSPKPVDFDDKSYPEFYPVEPDVNIINQDVNSPEEEYHRPKPLGTWDPDSVDAWDKRFLRIVMDDKRSRQQELQLIENGKRELEEERQQITIMKQQIVQQISDLKAKTTELELLIPLARQFQAMKVDVNNFIPWVDLVQEYSLTHNTDLTTAAFDIVKNLRAFKNLETIENAINQAQRQLVMLDMVSEQQKKAINTLIHLQQIGVTEGELIKLIGRWGGLDQSNDHGKLDTELINIRDVIQQSGSNNPDSVNGNLQQPNNLGSNNGHGGPSMNDFNYIRLHLLKGSTTNMLNRIGITHMPFSLHS